MHSNHYFRIGSMHGICEDYARSGITPNGRAYAIVSDGCSSSLDTDVGARIVSLEAERFIRAREEIPTGLEIAFLAREKIINLGLQPSAMDTTLIIALEDKEKNIKIHGWGDGAIISQSSSGWGIDEYEYNPNFPFYLSYLTDPDRMELWKESGLELICTSKLLLTEDIQRLIKNPCKWENTFCIAPEMSLFIVTDGLSSFEKTNIDPRNKRIRSEQIAEELIKVKFPRGKFVEKRVRRFLKNFKKEGIVNTDDFAVAGISRYLG